MAGALTVTLSREAIQRFLELAEFNEKQRRLFLGMLADQCGRGGGQEVAQFFQVARNTVGDGQAEFTGRKEISASANRIRRPGGGRKPVEVRQPGIVEAVREILEDTASGGQEKVLFWTTLSLREMEKKLAEQGFKVGRVTVSRLMETLGYSRQQPPKMLQACSPHPERDSQFRLIASLAETYLASGDPVISVDCRKNELLGNLADNGSASPCKEDARQCPDHEFALKELGNVTPGGVCVLNETTGFANLTSCSDSSEVAVESIRIWWQCIGKVNFPNAKRLLVTCDGGGSTGCSHRLWKEQLVLLAEETGLESTVCHFPCGTSKWNKVGHRLFCYVSRTCAGKPLIDIRTVVKCISRTTTHTGLDVSCHGDERPIRKGSSVSEKQMASIDVTPLGEYAQWNYTIRGFQNADA